MSSSVDHGGEEGRRRSDGATASSSWSAVEVRGCEALHHLHLPRLEARWVTSGAGLFFLLVLCWLHGGGSGSCGGSSGIWCKFKGAPLRRPATTCSVPRPDLRAIGSPLPKSQCFNLPYRRLSHRSVPSGLVPRW
jgi:hypothetical protein